MKRKDRSAEKRQPIPKRVSGDGSAPPRLSIWLSALFVFVACACRGGAKRRRSRIKDKHTPRLQIVFFVSRRKYRQIPLEEKSLLVQTRHSRASVRKEDRPSLRGKSARTDKASRASVHNKYRQET